MASFTIKHINSDGSFDTYSSSNIGSASIEFTTPTTPMPLPQQKDTDVILIKVEGNITTVNVSWTVIDEPSGNAFTGSNAETPMEQIAHFKTSFVPVDVNDSYELTIGEGSDAIVLTGILLKMGFSVSGRSPVTWEGRLQFVHGDVQTQYDQDLAKTPEYQLFANKTGTNGEVTLTNIHTDYLGSESAIIAYVIGYRQSGTTSWSTEEHALTNSSNQTFDVDLNVTGVYEIRVAAKTTVNTGMFTTPITVTIT